MHACTLIKINYLIIMSVAINCFHTLIEFDHFAIVC